MRGLWSRAGVASLERSGISRAAGRILGRSDNTLPFGVDDDLAVFLGERSDIGIVQDVEHDLRRAAQTGAIRRLDKGAVQQDGVLSDSVKQLVISLGRIGQSELLERSVLLAQGVAQRHAGSGDELYNAVP